MHWPRVNGRRFAGSCGTFEEANNLARMYGGTVGDAYAAMNIKNRE